MAGQSVRHGEPIVHSVGARSGRISQAESCDAVARALAGCWRVDWKQYGRELQPALRRRSWLPEERQRDEHDGDHHDELFEPDVVSGKKGHGCLRRFDPRSSPTENCTLDSASTGYPAKREAPAT